MYAFTRHILPIGVKLKAAPFNLDFTFVFELFKRMFKLPLANVAERTHYVGPYFYFHVKFSISFSDSSFQIFHYGNHHTLLLFPCQYSSQRGLVPLRVHSMALHDLKVECCPLKR